LGKIRIEVPATAPVAVPLPAVAPSAPATGTSKVQVAATSNSPTTSLPSDATWTTPTTPEDVPTLTSIEPGAANLGNDDSVVQSSMDKTTPDSSATFDQSANPGTEDDSRPANSQVSAPAAISELFAPVTLASNFSPSTQTVSVATALKQDPSSLSTSSASSNHGDVGGDTTGGAQLPSAVVVHRAAEAAELSAGLQAWNGGDNAQSRMVQSARLAGNLGESEMNISLRADALGAVELRTHVSGDLVGASISVDRHDAHAMLSSDLGSLHQALNDRQLRVGDVKIFQGSFGSDATAADGQSSQRREMAPQQQQASNWTSGSSSSSASIAATADSSEANMFFDSNGRLSVRA
jgi:flagellar hook-length control protein FliK